MKRRDFLRNVLAGVAGTAVLGLPQLANAAKGKTPKPGKVEGILVAANATSVSIRTQTGITQILTVNAATKVEKGGVRVAVTSLVIGARTQALFDPVTKIASKVEQA